MTASEPVEGRELQDKESIEGRFTIVSDAGEKDIAYIITGYSMKAKTSLGMGDDLFHFTNIVQKSREEAAVLYRSENFKSIFLKNDENLINLYEVCMTVKMYMNPWKNS